MAIKIITKPSRKNLFKKSHWWGFPDLPENVDFPVYPDRFESDEEDGEDLLTFICQINLKDIAQYDKENQLPHKGFLYFFASLDYFLGDFDAPGEPLGFWPDGSYKVIYTPETNELFTHKVCWEGGEDACLPAEAISFETVGDCEDDQKLLGLPFYEEVREEAPQYISLLQLDENDRWGVRFYDCGMLNFLISKDDLRELRFDKVKVYFHSA